MRDDDNAPGPAFQRVIFPIFVHVTPGGAGSDRSEGVFSHSGAGLRAGSLSSLVAVMRAVVQAPPSDGLHARPSFEPMAPDEDVVLDRPPSHRGMLPSDTRKNRDGRFFSCRGSEV